MIDTIVVNESDVVQAFLANISRTPINNEYLTLIATEYQTGAGFIDVLAKGETTGKIYILEFKHPEGSDKMVGQIARYIGAYVLETGIKRKNVFGVAIADGFRDHVRYAAASIQNLILLNYRTEILPAIYQFKQKAAQRKEFWSGYEFGSTSRYLPNFDDISEFFKEGWIWGASEYLNIFNQKRKWLSEIRQII